METDEAQMSKRTRMANGGGYEAAARKEQQDEDEDDGEGGGGGKPAGATPVRFLAWQQQLQLQHQQLSHASRICRVSRASGGKDRHSKVFTAKGLRDRRVRLSVPTAIQFYDLQDRLGYDQPSKAVEWLIKAASAAISELPSLDAAFAQMSGPLTDTKYITGGDGGGAGERTVENHGSSQHQQQHMSLTKSACSSNSDTSKGSVLSLSRSETRVKARERAKERATTKEKDGGGQENVDNNNNHDSPPVPSHHQTTGLNPHSSFTELLTFGVAGGGGGSSHTQSPLGILQAYSSGEGGPTAAVHKQIRQLHPTATTADYFNQPHSNPFTQGQKPQHHHHNQPQGFTAMPHFTTNAPTIGMLPFSVTTAVASAAANSGGGSSDHHSHHHHHHEIHQQYPFLQDHHLIPTAVASGGGDFGSNLSFSISSGLAGFNRGTLQSNSTNGSSAAPHLQQHLQRLSASQVDGSSNLPFFFGAVAQPASASAESPFAAGFDARLQLYYGDGYRSSDLKGKEKS